jgi:3-hydroxybutyryl-CoA dehydratase
MGEQKQEFSGHPRDLDQSVIARYAAASGDHNPIHLDEEFAAGTPFGGTIAHGMLLLAYIGEMLGDHFGAAWMEGSALKVRFRAPARPGQRVVARGRLERLEDAAAGGRRAVCAVECVNEQGEVLVSGEARITVSQ